MIIRLSPSEIKEITEHHRKSAGANMSEMTGIELYRVSPRSLQEIIKALVKADQGHNDLTKVANNRLVELQQRTLKILVDSIERQQREEALRNTRTIEAFMNTKVQEPVIAPKHQMFANVDGNIKRHQQAALENTGEILQLQAELKKKGPPESLQDQREKVKRIEVLMAQQEKLTKEGKTIKPDQKAINNAFLNHTRFGNESGLKTLKDEGYRPDGSTQQKLSEELIKGNFHTNTLTVGSMLNFGKDFIKSIKDKASNLFTHDQVQNALKDPEIATSKERRVGQLAENTVKSEAPIYNRVSPNLSAVSDEEIEARITRKYGLKIDLSAGRWQPEKGTIQQPGQLMKF